MSEPDETDVLVIGAGPGGYAAAIRAGQLGLDVTLVERDAYGGTCLNYGCIPSKALITATDVAHVAATAEGMGIYADPRVEVSEMVGWKDGVVDRLTRGVEGLCKNAGATLIEGTATFVDDHTVAVEDGDGEPSRIRFEHAIVATGSRPMSIPGFDFGDESVWHSTKALEVDEAPDRLVVVGAGYIGMELSTVFARLGTEVTVVEMLDSVLPEFDADLAAPVRKRAEADGVSFHLGEAAEGWETTDDGIVVRTETEDGGTNEYPADAVLVAVGREPVTDTLGLDAIGLEPDDRGFLATDERLRTDLSHVFAVGDVAGEPMLAHKAYREGEIAAETIAGEDGAVTERSVPAVAFTDPEIGVVGMSADEAQAAGMDPVVGRFPFAASGRAMTTGRTDGFVQVVADGDSHIVVGGQVVGPDASEVVAELGLAIEAYATLEDLADIVHAHPTLSEAVGEAAAVALGRAIHTTNR